ncbi:hypothetical protein ONS96_000521 [Cadophora gregata f. sp. sojae]|nr:hypothetical protein ONS96_000521 [Cadophora gregata f. sp. sojae]
MAVIASLLSSEIVKVVVSEPTPTSDRIDKPNYKAQCFTRFPTALPEQHVKSSTGRWLKRHTRITVAGLPTKTKVLDEKIRTSSPVDRGGQNATKIEEGNIAILNFLRIYEVRNSEHTNFKTSGIQLVVFED